MICKCRKKKLFWGHVTSSSNDFLWLWVFLISLRIDIFIFSFKGTSKKIEKNVCNTPLPSRSFASWAVVSEVRDDKKFGKRGTTKKHHHTVLSSFTCLFNIENTKQFRGIRKHNGTNTTLVWISHQDVPAHVAPLIAFTTSIHLTGKNSYLS